MPDAHAKLLMLGIAESYEEIAKSYEKVAKWQRRRTWRRIEAALRLMRGPRAS
jgi:hypothetical protein